VGRRVYDARELARNMRERFVDRPVEREFWLGARWPLALHNVGDSLAVAYASDKWQPPADDGHREYLDYKHLAESRNRVLVVPGLLRDFYRPTRSYAVVGPMVSLPEMPNAFAWLGFFEEANLQLYTDGTDDDPRFGGDDDGVVKVTVRHGMLGGSYLRTSKRDREPFLFVYTERDGILMIVVGEKLNVEKDGIVG
jgi:hypothetical protein